MTVHLLRPAVGIESVPHLFERQKYFRAVWNGKNYPIISTKRKPVRADELIKTGSIYWVIKSAIRARQKIIHIEMVKEQGGDGERCIMFLDEGLTKTTLYPHRAFQGWRYLDPSKTPNDTHLYIEGEADDEIPQEMEGDLRDAGLV